MVGGKVTSRAGYRSESAGTSGSQVVAYRRWAQMEEAMRNNRELPFSGVTLVMTVGVAAAAFVLAVLLLVAR